MDEYKKVCEKFNDGVYTAIDLEKCVCDRIVFGGPAPSQVKLQAAQLKKRISEI